MTVMITFRRLTREDFGVLAGWLAEPHVAEWWAHEYTLDAVEQDFGRAIDDDEPGEDYLALLDEEPLGIVQYCHFVDYPEYVEEMAEVYPVGVGAVSIDYLVGSAEFIGHGLGTAMIRSFVDRVWHTDPAATHVVVPVNSANIASWRALLAAGFHRVARGELEPDAPDHDRMHEVLRLDRPGTASSPVEDVASPS